MFSTSRSLRTVVLLVTISIAATASAQHKRRAATRPTGDITIIQTTDIHDHANGATHNGLDVDPVNGTSLVGAYSRIAAYINGVRTSAGHPVILVDSGDWTMGTLYDLTLASQPLALYFLNAMKYDAVTLGNHEFDYTPRGLAQMLGAARTAFGFAIPIVASNATFTASPELSSLVAANVIRPSY